MRFIPLTCPGIAPRTTFLEDVLGDDGKLQEPDWRTLDVNLKGVLNTVTLGLHHIRKNGLEGGSIVVTASVTSRPPNSSHPYALTSIYRLYSLRRHRLRYVHAPPRLSLFPSFSPARVRT